MAQIIKRFEQDLTKDVSVRQCGAVVYNADDLSTVVAVDLFDGGEPATLTGASVVGSVICPDGATVYVNNGSISGNTARITLTAACFAVPGQIAVCIQLVSGETKTTVLKAMFHVEKSITDEVLDPEGRVTLSVSDLIAKINASIAELPANIVVDYAALTELDTDDLPAGYIVKVLTDSTHGNRKTYYKWTGAAWTYITTDTAGYTTAEADALLAEKQDLIQAFVRSASVSGNTLTIVNKDGSTVTFTPGGSGEPAAYIKAAVVSGQKLTLTKKDGTTVDFDLSSAFSSETSTRQEEDAALQAQIDALVSKSDVVDVVADYTALQSYDTAALGDNDVVKVLDDSTHNNSRSYYRWVITDDTGEWSYIGSEAVGYTKSEADTLLNAKQPTISDLANIRSGATAGTEAGQTLAGYSTIEAVITFDDDTTETYNLLYDTAGGE